MCIGNSISWIQLVYIFFPTTCSHNPAADMYTSYGRNCHNLMCFEARTKTIGQMTGVFPAGQPIRFYKHSGNATQSLPALKGCRTTSTLPTYVSTMSTIFTEESIGEVLGCLVTSPL